MGITHTGHVSIVFIETMSVTEVFGEVEYALSQRIGDGAQVAAIVGIAADKRNAAVVGGLGEHSCPAAL